MLQRVLFAALLLALGAIGAQAQLPLHYPIEPPAKVVRESLETPFARVLLGEFARTVVQNADAACLQSKGLDETKLIDRGRELFLRWGTKSIETVVGIVDVKRYEAKIAERAGRNAVMEIMRLRDDPGVKRYLEIERPLRLARVLGFIIENFDRYVLITRIKLDSIAPVSNGKDELLRADPTEAIEETLEKFVNENQSPRFKRFYQLSEIAAEALLDTMDRDLVLTWGPATFFRGVEIDLAELCVVKR